MDTMNISWNGVIEQLKMESSYAVFLEREGERLSNSVRNYIAIVVARVRA